MTDAAIAHALRQLVDLIADACADRLSRRGGSVAPVALGAVPSTTGGGLNREEAGAYLSVDPKTIDALVKSGELVPAQLPGLRLKRYLRSDLDRLLRAAQQRRLDEEEARQRAMAAKAAGSGRRRRAA